MTRFLSNSMQAAANSTQVEYRMLAQIGVQSGTMYACNGTKYLYAMGNTYTPVGILGGVDPIKEDSDPYPRTIRLWLSAVGSANIYAAMTEDMFNRPVKLFRTFIDQVSMTQTSSAELMWNGKIDSVKLRMGDASRGNFFEVEARTSLFRRARASYFNRETLMQTQSGDTFADLVTQVPLFKSLWGQQATSFHPNLNTGGGAKPPKNPGQQH